MGINLTLSDHKAVIYNAVDHQHVVYNGEEVWHKAEPFYLIFTDFPLAETEAANCASKSVTTQGTGYSISCKKGDTIAYASLRAATGAIPAQNCNKVRVKYDANCFGGTAAVGSINGAAVYDGTTDGFLTFDVVGETFTLELHAQEETASFTTTLTVKEVYFFYE